MTTDATRLRAELARLGLSQRGLARLLDLSDRTIRRYCAGTEDVPRVVWLALSAITPRDTGSVPPPSDGRTRRD